MRRPNRRQTLIGLGAGLAVSPALAATGSELASRLLQALTADPMAELATLWRQPDSARFFGAQYLARYPDAADVQTLAAQIIAEPAAPLVEQVAARIRTDWDEGRQIKISGCFLSLTEARLCALAVLLS